MIGIYHNMVYPEDGYCISLRNTGALLPQCITEDHDIIIQLNCKWVLPDDSGTAVRHNTEKYTYNTK
jgi:hypothetical protein